MVVRLGAVVVGWVMAGPWWCGVVRWVAARIYGWGAWCLSRVEVMVACSLTALDAKENMRRARRWSKMSCTGVLEV